MVRVGDRWGTLECIDYGVVEDKVMGTDADGKAYVAESTKYKAYKLQCVCGTLRTVPVKEFKGKSRMRDCGCGRAGFSGENVVIAFSTNTGVKGHLQQLARYDGQSVSYVINEALREYFERRSSKQEIPQGQWSSEVPY